MVRIEPSRIALNPATLDVECDATTDQGRLRLTIGSEYLRDKFGAAADPLETVRTHIDSIQSDVESNKIEWEGKAAFKLTTRHLWSS